MKAKRRTTHRSNSGTKLYAWRDMKGRFQDIKTYKQAHAEDLANHKQQTGVTMIAVFTNKKEAARLAKLIGGTVVTFIEKAR